MLKVTELPGGVVQLGEAHYPLSALPYYALTDALLFSLPEKPSLLFLLSSYVPPSFRAQLRGNLPQEAPDLSQLC